MRGATQSQAKRWQGGKPRTSYRSTIYDVRFLNFEVRRANRRVMGERMIPILRIGADFFGSVSPIPDRRFGGGKMRVVLKYELRITIFEF